MIQTIPRRGRKQPKWDPSQNRQKQPLPKPKTTRKCPKTPQQQYKTTQNNRKPLKTAEWGGPPIGELFEGYFLLFLGLFFIVFELFWDMFWLFWVLEGVVFDDFDGSQ